MTVAEDKLAPTNNKEFAEGLITASGQIQEDALPGMSDLMKDIYALNVPLGWPASKCERSA